MPNFKFDGPQEVYYSTLGLTASPGDVREFDEAPDALWTPTGASVTTSEAPAEPVLPDAPTGEHYVLVHDDETPKE